MDSNETIIPTEENSESGGELSHSDKMIGVFTEPSNMFSTTSKFPPRAKDWVIPVFIMLVIAAFVQIILMSNSEISFGLKQKQMAKIEEQFNQAVEAGEMTREQADQQLDNISERMNESGIQQYIIQSISIIVIGFLIFIFIASLHFIFSKFVLKGEGTFTSAMVANGLVTYIILIQIITAAVLSILVGRMIQYIDLTTFLEIERSTFLGFLCGKVDLFAFWIYTVLGIGMSKMFRSTSTTKYILMVFGVWVFLSFIIYLLVQAFPFLKLFMQ